MWTDLVIRDADRRDRVGVRPRDVLDEVDALLLEILDVLLRAGEDTSQISSVTPEVTRSKLELRD